MPKKPNIPATKAIATTEPYMTAALLPVSSGVGEGVIVGVTVGTAVAFGVGVGVGVAVGDGFVVGFVVGDGVDVGEGVEPEPEAKTKMEPGPFTVAVVEELPELAMVILAVLTDHVVKL